MEFDSKDTEFLHYWRERLEKEISYYKNQLEERPKPNLAEFWTEYDKPKSEQAA
jgi:hypothetical protein